MQPPWEERFPGRLQYELDDFKRCGLTGFSPVEDELEQGRLVLAGAIHHDGAEVELRIVYPDAFPYFRPEVYAPGLRLGRHQNPYEGNLCLLEASSRAWHTNETSAWLVAERVPHLLDLVQAGGDALRAAEVPEGEPESAYVVREAGSAVFVTEEMFALSEDATHGAMYLSWNHERIGPPIVHALLRQVNVAPKSGAGRPAAVCPQALKARFTGPSVEGRWVRLDQLPERDPEALFQAAEEVWRGYGRPPWQRVGDAEVAVLGVVVREEVQQGALGDNWIFAIRWRTPSVPVRSGAYLTVGERYSEEDLFARIPRLRGIQQKRATVVGLGSLGAPTALELARAQIGGLKLLDADLVEAGTTVRWPAGIPAVGSLKSAVVAGIIASYWPNTFVEATTRRLGTAPPRPEAGVNDFELLGSMLDGSDVAVEATGEVAVQQLVADLAQERGVPHVFAWGTEGAFGGAVVRVLPGQTGCWYCLQLAFEDGSIPVPPHEPTGLVQPPGCGGRTFTGESFNQLPIIAQTARVVVHTLLGSSERGEDVAILSLRNGADPAPAPIWSCYPLHVHHECSLCGNRAAA